MPGPKCYAITLQGALDRLANDGSIETQRRRELRWAIARFADACGRSPAEIIADAQHINYLLGEANWQRLGIKRRTWDNIMTLVRTALQLVGVDIEKRRNFRLTPEWEEFLAVLPERKRQDLSRFAGFCTLMMITPGEVTAETFAGFLKFCQEQVIHASAREKWQVGRRAWNHLAKLKPELGLPVIPNTGSPRWRGLAWEDLPQQLTAEIDRLGDWLVNVDPMDDDRDPVRSVTARNYTENIRRYVSHQVEMGVPLEHLSSLDTLLDPELVKRFFGYRIDQRGRTREELKLKGDPSLYAYVAALIAAARFVNASDDQWRMLQKIGDWVRPKQWELSQRNRERVNVLSAPDVEPMYFSLPLTICSRFEQVKAPTIAEALEMRNAVALQVLTRAPIRIRNLVELDLERHIRRAAGGVSGNWIVHIDGHEVKNDSPIDIELRESTSAMLDRYVTVFRPALLRKGPCSALFMSAEGNPITTEGLAKALKKLVRRELGIKWNPHIVRAHAGWISLQEDAGNYRGPQRLLGHRNIKTTTSYYLPLERANAFQEYDAMVERRRARTIDNTGPSDASPDRRRWRRAQ